LTAGGAVDLGAQFGDAVFIAVLHLGLTGDQPRQDVIAEREIGRGCRRPHAEHGDRPDRDPEYHRPEADLLAGMDDGVAVLRGRRCGRSCDRRSARRGPAMILRVVVLILEMMTGTVRHRHSRAGRIRVRTAKFAGLI